MATAGHNQGLRTIPKMDMAIKISNMRGMEKTITLTGVRSLKIKMMRMMICGDCSQHYCMQSPYLCIYDGVLALFNILQDRGSKGMGSDLFPGNGRTV
jgi:hypothetical protein